MHSCPDLSALHLDMLWELDVHWFGSTTWGSSMSERWCTPALEKQTSHPDYSWAHATKNNCWVENIIELCVCSTQCNLTCLPNLLLSSSFLTLWNAWQYHPIRAVGRALMRKGNPDIEITNQTQKCTKAGSIWWPLCCLPVDAAFAHYNATSLHFAFWDSFGL